MHEVLKCIFSYIFSTIEERKDFIRAIKLDDVIYSFILHSSLLEDAERILSLFYDSNDIKHFKKDFAEKNCCELLENEHWKTAGDFVQWCFTSKEEVDCFYRKFFKSKIFAKYFCSDYLDSSLTSIVVPFIIQNKLEKLLKTNDLVLDICLNILSHFYISPLYVALVEFIIIFKELDSLLLACNREDQIELKEVKKAFLAVNNKKLILSFSLNVLRERIPRYPTLVMGYTMWCKIMSDFFNWICSSDEKLKAEMEEEFWNLEEVLEAKKCLQSKDVEEKL